VVFAFDQKYEWKKGFYQRKLNLTTFPKKMFIFGRIQMVRVNNGFRGWKNNLICEKLFDEKVIS
jgi:hypothetical protein